MARVEYEHDPQYVIKDRLYGDLSYNKDDLRLYQTPELARLRQVSLSAVAPWIMQTGICASKFEHSVGAQYLARIVGRSIDSSDIAKDLEFAALIHDAGTPPFSHTSEHFQKMFFGMDHEEFIDVVLDNSSLAQEIEIQGGNIERITRFVKGKDKPFSDIINGTIDVDNMDNTLRWGLSTGVIRDQTYSPEKLAHAYTMLDGELILAGDIAQDLQAWESVRKNSYDYIYSPAQLAPSAMLWRGLYFAFLEGELSKEFFLMTDAEAYTYLVKDCNERTQTILEKAKSWQFYERYFNYQTNVPSEQLRRSVDSPMIRGELADELSRGLQVEPADVCVVVGKDKGFKQIHLPIITPQGVRESHKPTNGLNWYAQVYISPQTAVSTEAIQEFVNDRLKLTTNSS